MSTPKNSPRTKLTTLTDAQHDRMASFAQEWIEYGWRTTPLTEEEWAVWEQGARKCYDFAGIPWPGVVIRVPNPIVGAFAAPFAAITIELHRRLPKAIADVLAKHDADPSAVDSAVDSAVGSAVDSAVDSAVENVKPFWHYWFGGRVWAYWPAFIAFFRDVAELQLDPEIWDRSKAYEDALSAGYWWPNKDFVMVCDVPTIMDVEAAAGQHRLHCETGPAVAWADGFGFHYWHGTRVPADLIVTGWDVERIMKESNTEVRRCAIERMGWDQFVETAGFTLADECDDPGNPGQKLRLYDVPRKVLDLPVRVLVATNATRERDGSRHTFGLTIPTDCRTALAAAAWTFDLTEAEYRNLARAS